MEKQKIEKPIYTQEEIGLFGIVNKDEQSNGNEKEYELTEPKVIYFFNLQLFDHDLNLVKVKSIDAEIDAYNWKMILTKRLTTKDEDEIARKFQELFAIGVLDGILLKIAITLNSIKMKDNKKIEKINVNENIFLSLIFRTPFKPKKVIKVKINKPELVDIRPDLYPYNWERFEKEINRVSEFLMDLDYTSDSYRKIRSEIGVLLIDLVLLMESEISYIIANWKIQEKT